MNFSNSSSNVSRKQLTSSNASFFKRNKLVFLIILPFLMLLLSILIFLFITKCIQNKKKKIQRQKVIIKKHVEPKTDMFEDPQRTLLEQNDGETINMRIINNILLTNPVLNQQLIDTPRRSTFSVASPLSERNDNDDLSDLDLTNIPLRRIRLSNKNLDDPSLLQNTNQSSHGSSENPYMVEFIQQENEKAQAREQRINSRVSTGSKTSEESCL